MSVMSGVGDPSLPLYDAAVACPRGGERFLMPGPNGVLEAILDVPKTPRSVDAPIAVVSHPHSLHGGTFTNKVAHTVAKSFVGLGVTTLRFNFRGVGESSGEFDHGIGEVDDVQAAVDWLRVRYPQAPLWLAGFSFGAFVALSAQAQVDAVRLLLVAPPVAMFDFPADGGVTIPWMVIQGSADEIVDQAQVARWANQQVNVPESVWLEGASHFFHGRLIELRQHVQNAWQESS